MHDIGLFMIALTGCGLAIYLVISGVQDIRAGSTTKRDCLDLVEAYEGQLTAALEALRLATETTRLVNQVIIKELEKK